MTDWEPQRRRKNVLEKLVAMRVAMPDNRDVHFAHAQLLAEMGRLDEAKDVYFEFIKREPTHFEALNNFANLLYAQGFTSAARSSYEHAILHHPDNPIAHVNLANLLSKVGETELAMQHYETALRLKPDLNDAHLGIGYLLTDRRDEEGAALSRQKALQNNPFALRKYYGDAAPISVLMLTSAAGGMIPLEQHLDNKIFLVTLLFVEFFNDTTVLPPHQLIINVIGDADLCRPALIAAEAVLAKTSAPIINPPSRVLPTGRAENAIHLAGTDGIVVPKIATVSRADLERDDVADWLAQQGFHFPLLVRPPGFHTGQFFEQFNDSAALKIGLADMPGDQFLCIEYIDARDADGKIRKYRVMMIDGKLYPLHKAISHEWKIHYFTAEMAEHPDHRAEDEAFLTDMPATIGPRAMAGLERIASTLGLDYGGIDFSLNAQGEVILFEANASMVVYAPDADPRWDYRRPAVARILEAIRRMVLSRAH